METCTRCHAPLDDAARYAGSPWCSACGLETETMRDGEEPKNRNEEAA